MQYLTTALWSLDQSSSRFITIKISSKTNLICIYKHHTKRPKPSTPALVQISSFSCDRNCTPTAALPKSQGDKYPTSISQLCSSVLYTYRFQSVCYIQRCRLVPYYILYITILRSKEENEEHRTVVSNPVVLYRLSFYHIIIYHIQYVSKYRSSCSCRIGGCLWPLYLVAYHADCWCWFWIYI